MDRVDQRALLEEHRTRALRRVADLTGDLDAVMAASRDTNADDEHDPEGATIAFERSQVDAVLRQALRRVQEYDAALRRLEAGTYGVCEVCGEPIEAGRLEARPEARTCIRCASARRR